MSDDHSSDVHASVIEALSDPLRIRVFCTIVERPGATVAQVAARTGEPARRVRHQIERLVSSALVIAEGESARRNTRERHYRALARPVIFDEGEEEWTEEERRKLALSALRYIVADITRAMHGETFGTRPEHTENRIPGEVDEAGLEELARIMRTTTGEIEETMVASAARRRAAGRSGLEVISALLLFEAPPWDTAGEDRQGPRPSMWLDEDPPAGA